MKSPGDRTLTSIELPLCVSYTSLQCGIVRPVIHQVLAPASVQLLWCSGTFTDGQSDVLGVWWSEGPQDAFARRVAHDLVKRGLKKIGLLINGASDEVGTAILDAFPSTASVKPFHSMAQLALAEATPGEQEVIGKGLKRVRDAQTLNQAHSVLELLNTSGSNQARARSDILRSAIAQWSVTYALPSRARKRVRRSDAVWWPIQNGLTRALTRHGPFSNPCAAAAFADTWLVRAERRQRGRRKQSLAS